MPIDYESAMSLDHAILGFLALEPMSGYDLKRVFDQSVQHFWPATQSQIYRSLGKMADQAGLSLSELDLYLWYLETGKVLK